MNTPKQPQAAAAKPLSWLDKINRAINRFFGVPYYPEDRNK